MIKIPTVPGRYLRITRVQKLRGRVLELPNLQSEKRTPILLIYGHHSSLERMYSIAQAFNEYGPVTMPDLPGFGGMPSLLTVGQQPTLDNLADYLADFIKTRFPAPQKFVIGGMSLGFVIATRMLQRHPELSRQVVHLISVVGCAHHSDFLLEPRRQQRMARAARLMAKKYIAAGFSGILLRKPIIASIYHLRARNHPKMKGYTWRERQTLIDFEYTLWRNNEVATYFSMMHAMLTLDLTAQKVPMAVEHVAVANDQYFSNERVVQHLGQIFTEVHVHEAQMPNHAPTVIEGVEAARALLPASLGALLARQGGRRVTTPMAAPARPPRKKLSKVKVKR